MLFIGAELVCVDGNILLTSSTLLVGVVLNFEYLVLNLEGRLVLEVLKCEQVIYSGCS